MAPRNYKGPGHETFATFFMSIDSTFHDPYFQSVHEIIYQLLWNTTTKSNKYPVTVFVVPGVNPAQIASFEAGGAIVRQVEEVPWNPSFGNKLALRLKGIFAKLEMWRQTDFTRIAYFDGDAIPIAIVDALLETSLISDSKCKAELLAEQDRPKSWDVCQYLFAGVRDEMLHTINAGMFVLAPNQAMHGMLIRESHNNSNFDNGLAEQALLTYVFREDGPFPPTFLSEAYNGSPSVYLEGRPLYVVHGKAWVHLYGENPWDGHMWFALWDKLAAFYATSEFVQMRARDDQLRRAIIDSSSSPA